MPSALANGRTFRSFAKLSPPLNIIRFKDTRFNYRVKGNTASPFDDCKFIDQAMQSNFVYICMCVGKKFLCKEKKNSKYIWTMRYNEIFYRIKYLINLTSFILSSGKRNTRVDWWINLIQLEVSLLAPHLYTFVYIDLIDKFKAFFLQIQLHT